MQNYIAPKAQVVMTVPYSAHNRLPELSPRRGDHTASVPVPAQSSGTEIHRLLRRTGYPPYKVLIEQGGYMVALGFIGFDVDVSHWVP